MKSFNFIYTNSEGIEKEVQLRLKSVDCEQIEKTYNCVLLDYVQQYSVTAIITLLTYMRRGVENNFTKNQGYDFYDELVDAGYSIFEILDKVVYETLVVSGVITQEQLDDIRKSQEEMKKSKGEKQERKN